MLLYGFQRGGTFTPGALYGKVTADQLSALLDDLVEMATATLDVKDDAQQ